MSALSTWPYPWAPANTHPPPKTIRAALVLGHCPVERAIHLSVLSLAPKRPSHFRGWAGNGSTPWHLPREGMTTPLLAFPGTTSKKMAEGSSSGSIPSVTVDCRHYQDRAGWRSPAAVLFPKQNCCREINVCKRGENRKKWWGPPAFERPIILKSSPSPHHWLSLSTVLENTEMSGG